MPKSYTVGDLKPLVGQESIIIKEGHEWKELRKRFNPGFAPAHLMGLLPVVTDKVWTFMRLLERVADAEDKVVKLDKLTQGLTVDVIGEVVMEVDVGAQEELLARPDLGEDYVAAAAAADEEEDHDDHDDDRLFGVQGQGDQDHDDGKEEKGQMSNFTKIYYRLITSYAEDGKPPIEWLQMLTKPFGRRRRQYLAQKVDTFLQKFVQRKHLEEFRSLQSLSSQTSHPSSHPSSHQFPKTGKPPKSRSILSLSLSDQTTTPHLPPKILSQTSDALKTFLFAGHDTTAILIGWVVYYLSICPRAHSRVTSELDSIFGPGASPAEIRAQLSGPEGPEKLNKMVYTHAVIKEALRLHPPAGTARRAEPGSGFVVREPAAASFTGQEKGVHGNGNGRAGAGGGGGGEWLLDGMVLYNCATIIHRDPEVYGQKMKDEFWPERWLSSESSFPFPHSYTSSHSSENGSGEKMREQEIPAGAWRPFERGPRDCIGRDLAIIETKVVVALVHGRYKFVKVGLGEKVLLSEEQEPVVDGTGCCVVKEKLYTRRQVTARAADGMRMKVRLAKGVVGGLEG